MSALLKLWKHRGKRKELGQRKVQRKFDRQSFAIGPRGWV